MHPHEQFALFTNHCLTRLPLIYEILEELAETADANHPGDEDLRRGAFKAVNTMVERLRTVEPPLSSDCRTPPTQAEQIAGEWLIGDQPRQLLPPDLYRELATLIVRLFPRTTRVTGFKPGGLP